MFGGFLVTFVTLTCVALVQQPHHAITSQEALPQSLQQALLAKKCKITLKEGRASFLVSVSSYILLCVLPPNISAVKKIRFLN